MVGFSYSLVYQAVNYGLMVYGTLAAAKKLIFNIWLRIRKKAKTFCEEKFYYSILVIFNFELSHLNGFQALLAKHSNALLSKTHDSKFPASKATLIVKP